MKTDDELIRQLRAELDALVEGAGNVPGTPPRHSRATLRR